MADDVVVEKVLSSFDQAMSRGVPAIKIVRGVARTFDLRRERVLTILRDADRIRTLESDGATILWSTTASATNAATNPARRREAHADLMQAGVDYAIAHQLITGGDTRKIQPARLLDLVKTSLDSAAMQLGERSAA